MTLTKGQGADVVLDAVGGALFEPCLGTLRIGGRQIVMAGAPTPLVYFNLTDFYHKRTRLLGMDTMKLTGQEIVEIFDQLRVGFDEGHLQAPQVEIKKFDLAVEAYQGIADHTLHKKQVLKFPALSSRF